MDQQSRLSHLSSPNQSCALHLKLFPISSLPSARARSPTHLHTPTHPQKGRWADLGCREKGYAQGDHWLQFRRKTHEEFNADVQDFFTKTRSRL